MGASGGSITMGARGGSIIMGASGDSIIMGASGGLVGASGGSIIKGLEEAPSLLFCNYVTYRMKTRIIATMFGETKITRKTFGLEVELILEQTEL